MKNKFYSLIILFCFFSCGNEKKDSSYDTVSHSVINYPDTSPSTILALDTLSKQEDVKVDSTEAVPVDENLNSSTDYKVADIGEHGITTFIFVRNSPEQSPVDYIISSLHKWDKQGSAGMIMLLGKSEKGIWTANGYSQDGSGAVYLYLVLSDSSGKQQKHRLLKADEETNLESDFIENLLKSKLDTLITEKIIPINDSDYAIQNNATNVLNVFDETKNNTHQYYFTFSTFMCWDEYYWDYGMESGKKLSGW